jgi:hypothetical protein
MPRCLDRCSVGTPQHCKKAAARNSAQEIDPRKHEARRCPPKQPGSAAPTPGRHSSLAATAESFGLRFMVRLHLRDRLFLSHRGCRCSTGSCRRGRGLGQYGRSKKGHGYEGESKLFYHCHLLEMAPLYQNSRTTLDPDQPSLRLRRASGRYMAVSPPVREMTVEPSAESTIKVTK